MTDKAPLGSGREQVHERTRFSVATIGIAVVATGALAITLSDTRSWFLAPLVCTMAWLVWALWVWPRVVTRSGDFIIRNTLVTHVIPYRDVDEVRSGLMLRVKTKSGQAISAYGVHGQTGMGWEAIRTANAHAQGVVQVRRVDDLRPTAARTQASQTAQIIASRPMDGSGTATRRVNVAIVAVSALVILGTAVALGIGIAR